MVDRSLLIVIVLVAEEGGAAEAVEVTAVMIGTVAVGLIEIEVAEAIIPGVDRWIGEVDVNLTMREDTETTLMGAAGIVSSNKEAPGALTINSSMSTGGILLTSKVTRSVVFGIMKVASESPPAQDGGTRNAGLIDA